MANDLTISNGAGNAWEQFGAANSTGKLLKFDRFGSWIAGQDAEKMAEDARFVAHINCLEIGHQKWLDGKPVERNMGMLAEGFVARKREELDCTDQSAWPLGADGKPKDPWQYTSVLQLTDINDGTLFSYSPSSRGGLGAIADLSRKYGRHIRSHPGDLPIVVLDSSAYRHPKFGEIKVPVLRIVDWMRGGATAAAVSKQNDLDDEIPF